MTRAQIVVKGRGGYCFEQNGLFYEILQELGFGVKLYLCRVIYNQDIHPGLTHRITLVELDAARYVVDVGFGALGPRSPICLSEEETIDVEHRYRVAEPRVGEFHMQLFKDGDWYSLYRFELVRYGQADCELGHFYSHKHPEAAFVKHLVVSRVLDREIRSLRDREYWVITDSGVQKQAIGDARQLRAVLDKDFRIQVTEAESRRLFEM